jgi:hypothetical protein
MSIMGNEETSMYWMPTVVMDRQGSDCHLPFGAYPPSTNYWHYLIGYLAPVCRAIDEQRDLVGLGGLEAKVIVNLQSSSDAMDGIAKEILESDQTELKFLAVESEANSSLISILKRFDTWSFRRFPWRGAPLRALHIPLRTWFRRWRWKQYPPVSPIIATSTAVMIPIPTKDALEWWWDAVLPSDPDYRRDIHALKTAVSRRRSESCSSEYQNKVLILRRPRTPTQTRVLRGDEMLEEQLVGVGIPAVIYEPGQHSFRCQVRVFQDAKGVVGLRGAEFANLLWCEGPIPIILIQHQAMHGVDPPQSKLGDLLDLTVSVITRTSRNVSIDVDINVREIFPLLAQHEWDR